MDSFWIGIWNDLKGLIDPFMVLVKGLGHIFAKIFEYVAAFLNNVSSK